MSVTGSAKSYFDSLVFTEESDVGPDVSRVDFLCVEDDRSERRGHRKLTNHRQCHDERRQVLTVICPPARSVR